MNGYVFFDGKLVAKYASPMNPMEDLPPKMNPKITQLNRKIIWTKFPNPHIKIVPVPAVFWIFQGVSFSLYINRWDMATKPTSNLVENLWTSLQRLEVDPDELPSLESILRCHWSGVVVCVKGVNVCVVCCVFFVGYDICIIYIYLL